MLAIRKRKYINFDLDTPGVSYSNATTTYNEIKGTNALYFDLNDDTAYLEIEDVPEGYLFVNLDITYIGTDETKISINSQTYYINIGDIIMKTKTNQTTSTLRIDFDAEISSGAGPLGEFYINGIEIFINEWGNLDVEPSAISITNQVKNTQDLSKVVTMFSKSFDLDLTFNNKNILQISENNINNNYIYDFRYSISDINFSGKLEVTHLIRANNQTVKCNLYSDLTYFVNKLTGNLRDVQKLSKIQYVGSQIEPLESISGDEEYTFVMHDYGQGITDEFFTDYKGINKKELTIKVDAGSIDREQTTTQYQQMFLNNYVPAFFAKHIFKQIHTNLGYVASGDFLDNIDLNNLLVMPGSFSRDISSDDYAFHMVADTPIQQITIGTTQTKETWIDGTFHNEYNNGTLVPGTGTTGLFFDTKIGYYTDIDYDVELEIDFLSTYAGENTIRCEFSIEYVALSSTGRREFVVNQQEVEVKSDETGKIVFKGTAKDVYIPFSYSVDKRIGFKLKTMTDSNANQLVVDITSINISNVEKISTKYCPTNTILASDILPDMTQQAFIKNIITMFNLYPTINNNEIEYLTRDQYYRQGEIYRIKNDRIDKTFEFPTSYSKYKYEFKLAQDDRGEIKKYNKEHEEDYGCYTLTTSSSNSETQSFNVDFSTPFLKEIAVGDFGVNSEYNFDDERKIYHGYSYDYYYNDWIIDGQQTFAKINIAPKTYDILEELFTTATHNYINTALPVSFETNYEYYKKEIVNLINNSSHKLKIKIYVDEYELARIKLYNTIQIDNINYIIEKINNWNSEKQTEITLIKRVDNPLSVVR